MHSEGIMAGELKHGPLALIDNTMPVMMIVTRDPVYIKCMNALQQVYIQLVKLLYKVQGFNSKKQDTFQNDSAPNE